MLTILPCYSTKDKMVQWLVLVKFVELQLKRFLFFSLIFILGTQFGNNIQLSSQISESVVSKRIAKNVIINTTTFNIQNL